MTAATQKAVGLFESLAAGTWDRIRLGEAMRVRQGEETISDLNLLEIARAKLPNVAVRKETKPKEGKTGIDWEWWIGSDRVGWWPYAVQAKRVSLQRRYPGLRQKVKGRYQIEILADYARREGRIPLYCFYNYCERPDPGVHWHCSLPYDEPQLGCTVVPLETVRKHWGTWGRKSFDAVHRNRDAFPWRCLVRCQEFIGAGVARNALATGEFGGAKRVARLPARIRELVQSRQAAKVDGQEVYDGEVRPERILVVDVEPESGLGERA